MRQRIQTLEGLSDDERAALLQLAAEGRSYGLVWEDREEAVEERLREELPVLVEDASLRIIGRDIEHELPRMNHELKDNNSREINGNSRGNESPNHILIEGDNLEALTALSYTHEGRVDVIYIDPPYNTGNKDFVYNDSFVDSEDSYRHSKWLSFMSKRLRIAKRLLSDRGVIFISIDDNEQANLKLLCDQVFGERNFVALMPVHRQGGRQDSKHFAVVHEYVFCLAKSLETFVAGKEVKEGVLYPKYDELSGRHYKTQLLRKWGSNSLRENRPNLFYPITAPDGTDVYPIIYQPKAGSDSQFIRIESCWRWSASNMANAIKEGRVEFSKNEYDEWVPYERIFAPAEGEVETKKYTTWIDDLSNGTTLLKEIFDGKAPFDYSKGLELIKLILKMGNADKSSTVLDFFAGSGTTLHAVMQLNKEDGGKRQCILVTNNENNICREVTYERNKRVIEGYTTPKGVQVEGLRENNLRYYRTHLLPRERTNRNMRALVNAATDLLCIKENLFEELKIKNEELRINDVRIFGNGERAMMVIYNEEVIPDIVDWLQTAQATNALTHSRTNAIKVYVFSPGAYAWDDDFAPVLDRVELCALPEAIYQAYKNVLPKKRTQRTTAETSPKGDEE